jgi:hypothetical protein
MPVSRVSAGQRCDDLRKLRPRWVLSNTHLGTAPGLSTASSSVTRSRDTARPGRKQLFASLLECLAGPDRLHQPAETLNSAD